jgi:CCR4-NOT transcriptional regulation complex NOT5 subunit
VPALRQKIQYPGKETGLLPEMRLQAGLVSGRRDMDFAKSDLLEAKRQIDSTLRKLRETVKTLTAKENVKRYQSQITLANRRIQAFEIANCLIERELAQL